MDHELSEHEFYELLVTKALSSGYIRKNDDFFKSTTWIEPITNIEYEIPCYFFSNTIRSFVYKALISISEELQLNPDLYLHYFDITRLVSLLRHERRFQDFEQTPYMIAFRNHVYDYKTDRWWSYDDPIVRKGWMTSIYLDQECYTQAIPTYHFDNPILQIFKNQKFSNFDIYKACRILGQLLYEVYSLKPSLEESLSADVVTIPIHYRCIIGGSSWSGNEYLISIIKSFIELDEIGVVYGSNSSSATLKEIEKKKLILVQLQYVPNMAVVHRTFQFFKSIYGFIPPILCVGKCLGKFPLCKDTDTEDAKDDSYPTSTLPFAKFSIIRFPYDGPRYGTEFIDKVRASSSLSLRLFYQAASSSINTLNSIRPSTIYKRSIQ
ncbi:MAG: hypothetical protein Sylvanvirus21_4 [Sylvanvirus sp.]|uniref:Uncharacterized protein n=1 Tax=Sylvanvirus sp. TaxID=2487774 RepID=A0A3G5AIL3_9VIRU|nr:MAG: hypothetical protein Sylvanvirus21_4 [Sylvanvirus sp.]